MNEQYLIKASTLRDIADSVRSAYGLKSSIPVSELVNTLLTGEVKTTAQPINAEYLLISRQTLVDLADAIRSQNGGTAEIKVTQLADKIHDVFPSAYRIKATTLKDIANAIRTVRHLSVNIPTGELASVLRTGRVLTTAAPTDAIDLLVSKQTLIDVANAVRDRSGETDKIAVDKLAEKILEAFQNACVTAEGEEITAVVDMTGCATSYIIHYILTMGEEIKAHVDMTGFITSYLVHYLLVMGEIEAIFDIRTFAKIAEIVKRARGKIPSEVSIDTGINVIDKVERRTGEIGARLEKMSSSAGAYKVVHVCGSTNAEVKMEGQADTIWLVEIKYACGALTETAALTARAKANVVSKAYGDIEFNAGIEGTAKIAGEDRTYANTMIASADVEGTAVIAENVERVNGQLNIVADIDGCAMPVERTYLETKCEEIEAAVTMSGYTTTFNRKHKVVYCEEIEAAADMSGYATTYERIYIVAHGGEIEASAEVSGYVTTYKREYIETAGAEIQAYVEASGHATSYQRKYVTAHCGTIEAIAEIEGYAELTTLIVIIEENEAGGLTYLITSDNYTVVDNAVYIGG